MVIVDVFMKSKNLNEKSFTSFADFIYNGSNLMIINPVF